MKHSRGFTLIELMITIGIMAIVITLAAPSFTRTIQSNKLDKVRDDLFADLVLARSEALARNKSVTLCATANPAATSPTCSNSNSWVTGWIMFVDTDQDRVVDAAIDANLNGFSEVSADEYLRIYRSASPQISISWGGGTDYIVFDRLGRMSGVSNGSFHFCNTSISYAKRIIISNVGRARFEGGATCS